MSHSIPEKFSLKDHLFNEGKVRYLADCFVASNPRFPKELFVRDVMSVLPTLGLKERITHIAVVLGHYLPQQYPQAVGDIIAALPAPLDPTKSDNDFGDFIFAPLGMYVVERGRTKEHISLSLAALREITMRFSMEDALRYFLRDFPTETFFAFAKWVHDPHYHVRRLVSESTRPYLPWSIRLSLPEDQVLPLLTLLHEDRTRFVTRSVANHLNDISKINPARTLKTLTAWQAQSTQAQSELLWLTKHALRTLVKKGNPDALALLGYSPVSTFSYSFIATCTPEGAGGNWLLHLTLQGKAVHTERVTIDYVIWFVKKNGTRKAKVFKWKTSTIEASKECQYTKIHRLKKDATTFTLYQGEHAVAVQINGRQSQPVLFWLE